MNYDKTLQGIKRMLETGDKVDLIRHKLSKLSPAQSRAITMLNCHGTASINCNTAISLKRRGLVSLESSRQPTGYRCELRPEVRAVLNR